MLIFVLQSHGVEATSYGFLFYGKIPAENWKVEAVLELKTRLLLNTYKEG